MSNILHILVEGDHDGSLVERVIRPWLIERCKYQDVDTFKYANRKKEIVENYIRSISEIGEDLLCLTDYTNAPCISGRKEDLIDNKIGAFDLAAIIVIVKEIEGWYLAGADDRCCRRMGISYINRTDNIRKQDFHSIISGSKYRTRTACRAEMLRSFDVMLATARNKSFYRLYHHFLI